VTAPTDRPTPDPLLDAGEYVLGTLEPAQREAFEAALARDPALQAEVYRWQDRLLPLAARAGAAEPAAGTWEAIQRRLSMPTVGEPTVVAPAGEAAANAALRRRLRGWQAFSGVAAAACLVLATLLLQRGLAPPPTERYLTLLQAPDRSTGWLVEVTAGQRLRLMPLGPPDAVPQGKALQFWTKLDGAAGPTSLGLVQPGQLIELPLDRLPGVAERQLFELTLEPATGSPIGRPTGPILYVGRSMRL
jgi:anti-sigma-K factor RskA